MKLDIIQLKQPRQTITFFYKTPSRTCDCDSDRGREHDMTSHKNLARERGNKYNLQIYNLFRSPFGFYLLPPN